MLKRGKFVITPSGVPGWRWTIEEGKKPEISEEEGRQIIRVIRNFAESHHQIKVLEKKLEDLKDDEAPSRATIIKFTQEHPGWRGALSVPEKTKLLVIPKRRIEWNAPVLRQILQASYYAVARETLHFSVRVPFTINGQVIGAEEITSAFRKALIELGVSADQVSALLEVKSDVEVDERKLTQISPQIPPEAKKEETIWHIACKVEAS